jgi:ribosomal protein S18 acetylase RimI-like enzyme
MVYMSFSLSSYSNIDRCGVARVVRRLKHWFEPDAWPDIDAQLDADSTLVAIDGRDQVIGFVVVRQVNSSVGRITWAGVDPDHQRRGIGRALLQQVIEEALAAGLTELRVETMSESVDYSPFQRTRAFYAAMGFEPDIELGDRAANGLATTDWKLQLDHQPLPVSTA